MRLRLLLVMTVGPSCFSESSGTSTNGSNETSSSDDATDPSISTTATTSATVGESSNSASTSATTGPDTLTSDSATTSPDTSATESESDTESNGCPDGSAPGPAVGGIWSGPFLLLPPDSPPCMQPLLVAQPTIVVGDPIPPAQCACSCDEQCQLLAYAGDDPTCANSSTPFGAPPGCTTMNEPSYIMTTGTLETNNCAAPIAVPPPVEFDRRHRLCGAPDEACVPTPPEAIGPCVRTDVADAMCEQQGFMHRIVVMTSAEATCASCDSCTEAAASACAEATVAAHGDEICGDLPEVFPLNDCSPFAASSVDVDFSYDCASTDALALTTAGVMTYCCAEPG